MQRRRLLAGIATVLMGASLVFTWSVSAHNIDLAKAWEIARDYARSVRSESGGKYLHYSTNCVRAFPNHNHVVRCLIDYQNAKDTEKGLFTCRETIEIRMPPHTRGDAQAFLFFASHTSANLCGRRLLKDTEMH